MNVVSLAQARQERADQNAAAETIAGRLADAAESMLKPSVAARADGGSHAS